MKIFKIPTQIILDSFKADTDVSSARVMQYLSWKFTKWWMIAFGGVALVMFIFDGFGIASVGREAFDGILKFFTWSVIILLTATYTPKSIQKFAEMMPKIKFFKDEDKG